MKTYFIIILLSLVFSNSFAQWQKCDGPDGGYNSYIASDGVNLYSAGYFGGFYSSTNGGQTWQKPACTGLPTSFSTQLIKPVNGKLYVSVVSYTVSGLFVSSDQGNTFTQLGASYLIQPPTCMDVSGNDIFIANTTYLYHSGDDGSTWSLFVTGLNHASVNDFLISGNNVFAATNAGIFSTTISGSAWEQGTITSNLNKLTKGNGILYTVGSSFYTSNNYGVSWNAQNTGLPNSFSAFDLLINNGLLYITLNPGYDLGSGVYTTPASTINWQYSFNGIRTKYVQNLASIGSTIYCSTFYAGISQSSNNGQNWTDVKDPENSMDIVAMVIDGGNIYATTNASVFKSSDQGQSWLDISNDLPPDTGFGAIDVKDNLIIGAYGGIYRSTNGGTNWTKDNIGLTDFYINSVVIIDSVVIAGDEYDGIFRSFDYGATWNASNNGLANYSITTLAKSGNNIFAGTKGGGIYLSADKGKTWNPVNNGIQHFDIFRLYADGTNIYATANTQYEYTNYLYLSKDNGTSWSQIFNHGEIVSAKDNIIYVMPYFVDIANDSVYRSTDGGITWAVQQYGLSVDTIYCTVMDALNVYMGTGLNSVWYEASNSTGILSVNSKKKMATIYPNPSSDYLTIQINEAVIKKTDIELTDILGQIIMDVPVSNSKTTIPVNNLSKGLYLINIKSETFSETDKIVVE